MQPEIRKTAEKFKKQGTKRRLWQRIVSGLTCIVVFCTTYALILPAITMEGDAFCGKPEHIHDPSCYNGVGVIHCDPVHYHSSGCYGEEGDLVCGQNEYVLHTHDSLCYGTDGSLICTLPEIAAHVHGDSCYTQVMPEGHRHEDGCYTLEQGELTCGQEESEGHGHGEGCYGEQVLTCQIPESAGHAHEPGCYSEPSLVCGQEEIEGHAHGEDCYGEDGSLTCQLPEVEAHVHGDGCYTQELICGQEESEGHSHGGTCFETPLVCTLAESEGHTHGDGCYAWNQVLVCQLEEVQPQNLLTCTVANEITHVHTEACRTEPELVCGQEVHTHTLACYSDSGADVETAELWKATMAGANLSGSDAQNLVTIAQTQLGYAESSRNYAVLEDEVTIKGYTRYGAWAGTPYADWSELFVEFCLHYAGISETDFPWRTTAKTHPETPASGDVIFLELENEQYAGIVTKVSDGYVTAILGDYHNEVRSETFSLADPDIKGYAILEKEETAEQFVPAEEAVDDSVKTTFMTMLAQTNEDASNSEPLANEYELPVTSISGVWSEDGKNYGAKYDPETNTFQTEVYIQYLFEADKRPEAGTTYTYTYPKGIVIPGDKLGEAILVDDYGETAGTYQFVENADGTYSIKIKYDQSYLTEHNTGEIKGKAHFRIELSKDNVNDEGNIVVGGQDGNQLKILGKDIYYPADETESYDINVAKTGGYYNSETKRLEYTVEVTSEKGTPDEIVLNDVITPPEGVTLGTPTVTSIKKTETARNEQYNGTWPIDGSTELLNNGVTPTVNGSELSMTLPKLERGPYTDPNNSSAECTKIGKYTITYYYDVADVTVSNPGVTNKVNVSSEDTTKGQTVTDSDEKKTYVSVNVDHTFQKSGRVDGDKILWTLTVNNNQVDIAGAELTDKMFDKMVENSMVISPSDGCTYENDKITFSTIGDTGVNKNKYTITYETPVEKGWNSQPVTNEANFNPPGDTPDIPQKITVNVQGVQLNKTGQHDSANNQINWTITINQGRDNITGATLTDEMFAGLRKEDIAITMNDGEAASGYQINTDDSGNITSIVFLGEGEQKNTNKYTITYSTAVPEDSASVTNNANLTPGEGTEGKQIGSSSTVDIQGPNLNKWHNYDQYNFKGEVQWTIVVNDNGKNIAGAKLEDTMFGTVTSVKVERNNYGETISADEYTVVQDGQGKISHILFNGIGETDVNTNAYKVTYTMSASKKWTSQTFKNTAKLTLGDKEISKNSEFTIAGSGSLGKTAGEIAVADGKIVIPWTIEVKDIPSGGIPAGTTIVDDLTQQQWDGSFLENHWITKEQAQSWSSNVILTWSDNTTINTGYSVSFVGTDGVEYTLDQVAAEGSPEKYKGFIISFTEDLIPPEGVNSFRFTYQSTTDGVDSIQNGTQFSNKVTSGDKTAGAQTQYHTLSAKKTDGNNQTQPSKTANSDGTLTWKVVVTMDHQDRNKLEVLDELPDGVILTGVSVKVGNSNDVALTLGEQGNLSGTVENGVYTVSGTYVHTSDAETGEKTNNVTLTLQSTDPSLLPKGKEIVFTYHCRVEDLENTSSGSYTNKATVKVDDTTLPDVEQEQKWTKQEEVDNTQSVAKRGTFDTDNHILRYTVDINPTGKDIVPGTGSANQDYLTLTDILEHPLKAQAYIQQPVYKQEDVDVKTELIHGSVKLYKAKTVTGEDGKKTPELDEHKNLIKDVEIGFVWTQEISDPNIYDGKHQHEIHATIPDGTPLILEYNYRVTTSAPKNYMINGGIDVSNVVTMQGESQGSTSSGLISEWIQSDADVVTSAQSAYTFYKVEQGNDGKTLAGAEFTVYRNEYDEDAAAWTWTENRKFTTGTDGIVQIFYDTSENADSKNVYEYNTLYKLVETKAPDGYKLSQTEYHFYFSSSTADSNLPDKLPSGTIDLSSTSETVYVKNEWNYTQISVNKIWLDKDGETELDYVNVQSLQFKLIRTGSDGSVVETEYTMTPENDDWSMTIENLPKSDPDTNVSYSYTIEEIPVEGYDAADAVQNTDGSWTLTNTKSSKIEITVEKKWINQHQNPTSPDVDSINFDLYLMDSSDTEVETVPTYTVTVKGGQYGEGAYENQYSVKEGQSIAIEMYCEANNGTVYFTGDSSSISQQSERVGVVSTEWYTWYVNKKTYTVPISGHATITCSYGTNETEVVTTDNKTIKIGISSVDIVNNSTEEEIAGTKLGTYSLSAQNGWKWKSDKLDPGTYKIVEANGANYNVKYTVNGVEYETGEIEFTQSGTIRITNTVETTDEPYELPETGGAGTFMYTLSGLVLCGTAALGYNHKKRRKEDHSS